MFDGYFVTGGVVTGGVVTGGSVVTGGVVGGCASRLPIGGGLGGWVGQTSRCGSLGVFTDELEGEKRNGGKVVGTGVDVLTGVGSGGIVEVPLPPPLPGEIPLPGEVPLLPGEVPLPLPLLPPPPGEVSPGKVPPPEPFCAVLS